MAKTQSTPVRLELLLGAATIAAHSTFFESGFRQRDVRFLFDLFANWVECCFVDGLAPIQNTQIARYLNELQKEGFIKTIPRKNKPQYRLTRIGLLELLVRITQCKIVHREQFFFLFYFIKNYRGRLIDLVQKEGSQFPPSVRMELAALLEPGTLIERERIRTENEIRKLELRCKDADAMSELARNGLKSGRTLQQIVQEAEKKFPYELNSQKPLHELIDSIPSDQRQWELEVGNRCRSEEIWNPTRQILRAYLAELKKMPLALSA